MKLFYPLYEASYFNELHQFLNEIRRHIDYFLFLIQELDIVKFHYKYRLFKAQNRTRNLELLTRKFLKSLVVHAFYLKVRHLQSQMSKRHCDKKLFVFS